jgi:hypothetical protein
MVNIKGLPLHIWFNLYSFTRFAFGLLSCEAQTWNRQLARARALADPTGRGGAAYKYSRTYVL